MAILNDSSEVVFFFIKILKSCFPKDAQNYSPLVISNYIGLWNTSIYLYLTYQICRIAEKNNSHNHI